jgi:LmbE family N-acetylglucosaminyl deacetylase
MSTAGAVLAQFRALPYGSVSEILGNRDPLILAPHPDDEVIGCGGLIAEALRHDLLPVIVFVTDGSGSHPGSRKFPPAALAELRRREACDAAAVLGVPAERLHFMAIRDTEAPHDGPGFAEAVDEIVRIMAQNRTGALLAPWECDPHGDHLAVHRMARKAARVTAVRHLSYPVWGWTLPPERELGDVSVAGWRLRVCRDLKERALREHRSQVSDLIDDDPLGFRLDMGMTAAMLSDDEVFLVNP